MARRTGLVVAVSVAGALMLGVIVSIAAADGGKQNLKAGTLVGFEENPDISTAARGSFRVRINDSPQSFTYDLSYSGLEGTVQQAHIHFGKRGVNGGITLFLCSNLGNGPAGTPTCPGPQQGTVSRTVPASEIVSPAVGELVQGIDAGNAGFGDLVAALRGGHTYANVHSTKWGGGEIRAQIEGRGNDDDDDD